MILSKTCSKCGEEKGCDLFSKDKSRKDGLDPWCKGCKSEHQRNNREAANNRNRVYRVVHKDKCNQYARDYMRSHKKERNQYAHRYKEDNPDRRAAHTFLNNSVRDGEITRPSCCDNCGVHSYRIEAHHSDYSKPLDVKWLCGNCRGKEHRLPNEARKNTGAVCQV